MEGGTVNNAALSSGMNSVTKVIPYNTEKHYFVKIFSWVTCT